jgi:hypothetical protein
LIICVAGGAIGRLSLCWDTRINTDIGKKERQPNHRYGEEKANQQTLKDFSHFV